jgi:hypothetical protein
MKRLAFITIVAGGAWGMAAGLYLRALLDDGWPW